MHKKREGKIKKIVFISLLGLALAGILSSCSGGGGSSRDSELAGSITTTTSAPTTITSPPPTTTTSPATTTTSAPPTTTTSAPTTITSAPTTTTQRESFFVPRVVTVPTVVTLVSLYTQISSGYRHFCARLDNGRANCGGNGGEGQLGNGVDDNSATPVEVLNIAGDAPFTGVTQISAGDFHTCALLDTGRVNCWGAGGSGQLGDGNNAGSATPVEVLNIAGDASLTGVTQISTGNAHTCALLDTDRVNCWGAGGSGQLGNGVSTSSSTPVEVLNIAGSTPLTGVTQISAGSIHTCALLDTGRVNCWGSGFSGQLGDGNNASSNTPVEVLNIAGDAPLTGVTQISAGNAHTCALLDTGRVNCWGAGRSGQLGDGVDTTDYSTNTPVEVLNIAGDASLTGVTQISAGSIHTCALLDTGRVNCWGNGFFGQLGDGLSSDSNTPVEVLNIAGDASLTGVTQISTGNAHTCALLDTDRVNCWGASGSGQLGGGLFTGSNTPVEVLNIAGGTPLTGVTQISAGNAHTCALLDTDRVNCWGAGGSGQLGNGVSTSSNTPVEVLNIAGDASLTGVTQISAGNAHTCALLDTGRVNCWGDGEFGQLGDGLDTMDYFTNTPVEVLNIAGDASLTVVTQISAGDFHTCALLDTGRVNCWGAGGSGQLGNGNNASSNTPVEVLNIAGDASLTGVTQISAGGGFFDAHTCALLDTGRVNCWGASGSGQLGNGLDARSSTPVEVLNIAGDAPLTGVTQISAGGRHTCALLDTGRVNCWGAGGSGQLGDGNNASSNTPVEVLNIAGGTPLTGVTQISAGGGFFGSHTCALLDTGRVNCWGNGRSGQLGDGLSISSNTPVEVLNIAGDAPLTGVTQISAGGGFVDAHTCALLDTGRVNCWGAGGSGQLGDGLSTGSSTPVEVLNIAGDAPLTGVTQISAGDTHTCSLLNNGRLYCWGRFRVLI